MERGLSSESSSVSGPPTPPSTDDNRSHFQYDPCRNDITDTDFHQERGPVGVHRRAPFGWPEQVQFCAIDGDWRLDHGDFFTTKTNDKQSNQAEGQQVNDGQQDWIHGGDGAEYTFERGSSTKTVFDCAFGPLTMLNSSH